MIYIYIMYVCLLGIDSNMTGLLLPKVISISSLRVEECSSYFLFSYIAER